jgi:hypothetical protein
LTVEGSTRCAPPPPCPPLPAAPPPPPPPPPPTVTQLAQTHLRWRDGTKLATLARKKKPKLPVGTTFSFALNESARVSLAFTQRVAGRNVKNRCVAQTHANRHKPACRRTLGRGALTFNGHPGGNRVRFQGLISNRPKLEPGRYTLTITATDTAGEHSAPQQLTFTIVQ